jgi:hypothetical protein
MAEERVQRRLAAILVADVAGHSRLMGEDEEGTLATLIAHCTELIEPCGALQCFVVERRPHYERSGYTRLVTWYDKAESRMQRVDYYNRNDALRKTLIVKEIPGQILARP